jgi:formylmethanofuran dehydrogenase subunit C
MPKGQYVPEGRKGRTLVVVDIRPTPTSKIADIFLQIRPGKDFEVLTTLIALVRGHAVDEERVAETGATMDQLSDLAARMKAARYGVLFHGMGLTMTRGKHHNTLAILTLGIILNDYTRFLAMPLRGHGNVTGADAVSGWLTGYPFGVDFSRGYPRYNPGEYTACDLLTRGECDAAMILAADPGATMPRPAIEHMARIPTIVLDPHISHTSRLARVHITTATTGISAPGTVYRMDEMPLKVRPPFESPYPTDEEVVRRIIAEVDKRLGGRTTPRTAFRDGPAATGGEPRPPRDGVVTLKLIEAPATPVEAEVISPDVIGSLSNAEILALPVCQGKRARTLGDFFTVEGDGAGGIELHGDLSRIKYIGRGMTTGSIAVHGDAGMHLGSAMAGGSITVHGNVGAWAGAEMRGGSIRVHGDAAGQVGAAYRGSPVGMRGGEIIIDGAGGIEVAMRMRRGLICIMGPCGDAAGLEMKGGTIVLGDRVGIRAGAWMTRGTIVALRPMKPLPTYVYSCAYQPTFLRPYVKHLAARGVALPDQALDGTYERYTGDTFGLGKGEILVCRPAEEAQGAVAS